MTGPPQATPEEVTTVDARDLRCPLPVIRLAAAARTLDPGAAVEVWATDPAADADVPAWCRMRGHALEATRPLEGGGSAYLVRVGGVSPS